MNAAATAGGAELKRAIAGHGWPDNRDVERRGTTGVPFACTNGTGERASSVTRGTRARAQVSATAPNYRTEYDIDLKEPTTLGPEPEFGDWEQRDAWRDAAEQVVNAREKLGIATPGLGPIEERVARVIGLAPHRGRGHDRGHGIDR